MTMNGDAGGQTMSEEADTPFPPSDIDADDIPVRNWWHMLLYALDLEEFAYRYDALVEKAPDTHALLVLILEEVTKRQLRRGLRGDYLDRAATLQGVRGRIDFEGTLRARTLHQGALRCEFDEHSVNVPRNRILVSTLQRWLREDFETRRRTADPRAEALERIGQRVERLVRLLSDLEPIRLSRQLIADELRKLGRNEAEYRLLLHLCEMLRARQMPREDRDDAQDIPLRRWRELQHREKSRIYEKFIANFYRLKLDPAEWEVRAQRRLAWNTPTDPEGTGLRLPSMQPDIALRHKITGQRIVIDTKWYKAVAETHYGNENVHRGNLYQMYAYLASQAHQADRAYRTATGILLYAQTREGARRLRTRIDDHPFWVHTLDLRQDWLRIEADLIRLIDEARRHASRAGDLRADASAKRLPG